MGQKVNPVGLRVGINRTWDSRWFADGSEYSKLFHEDRALRIHIMKMQRQEASFNLILQGLERVRLHRLTATEPFLEAEIEAFPYPEDSESEIEALVRTVKERVQEMHDLSQPPLTMGSEGHSTVLHGRSESPMQSVPPL